MSEGAFAGSITFTTDDEGNRRVAFTLSQPASFSATEVLESEDGRSEVSIDIVPPGCHGAAFHRVR